MLKFEHVCVTQPKPILHDVSFSLSKGCIHSLIGENGAGKSTLLKCALREVPYSGRILLNEKPLQAYSAKERAALVSVLPQHLPAPELSVREVIAFGFYARVTRLSPQEHAETERIMTRLNLVHLADCLVSRLSGGERQKVFLAMTLVQNTPVLLLDEPTTYMDLAFKHTFFALLREERDRGKSILLVQHDLADAVAVSDRIALLTGGQLSFFGTIADCLQQNIIERAFSVTRYTAQSDNRTQLFFR